MLWLIMLIISVITVLLLISPLIKPSSKATIDRLTINKQVYKDRIQELEIEREQQELTDDEFKALEAELKKNLLEDAHLLSEQKQSPSSAQYKLAWSLAGVLPLMALVIYYFIADWQAFTHWEELIEKHEAYQSNPQEGGEWLDKLNKQELLLLLRTRLYQEPEDTRGWLILGQTLGSLGATVPAQSALNKALQTAPKDQSLQLTVAQILTSFNQASAIEQAEQLVQNILQSNPDHEGALTIYGFIKAREGEYKEAIDVWQNLVDRRIARGEGEGKGVEILRQQIEHVKTLAQQSKQAPSDFHLSVNVQLAEELKGRFPANTRVFVVVRGDDGIPAPVAVKPMMLADLPVQLQLSDADAMMPGRVMSKMNTVKVSARISFSGQATPQPGDWQSEILVVDISDPRPVQLVISKPIP
jgi:cytochrome c-type biogenesis protein CcmH